MNIRKEIIQSIGLFMIFHAHAHTSFPPLSLITQHPVPLLSVSIEQKQKQNRTTEIVCISHDGLVGLELYAQDVAVATSPSTVISFVSDFIKIKTNHISLTTANLYCHIHATLIVLRTYNNIKQNKFREKHHKLSGKRNFLKYSMCP